MQDEALEKCKEEILLKLGKKPNEKWMGRELKVLADDIFQKSGIKLSVNTLKRIFGIIEYQGNPSLSTKDALAQYLDYVDWEDFLKKKFDTSLVAYEKNINNQLAKHNSSKYYFIVSFAAIVLLLTSFYFIVFHPKKKNIAVIHNQIDSSLITLKLNPAQGNVPLEFFIEYKKDTNINDTLNLIVENQGDYPIYRPTEKLLFTYLIPRKYKVSIAHNRDTIKSAIVNATTNGWMGMIYRVPNTVYSYNLYQKKNILSFPDSLINILDNEGNRYYIAFSNFKDFPVSGDEFRFKTRYRNTGGSFVSGTGNMYINLFCDNGTLKTSFINEGMLRYLKLIYSEKTINSVSNDLSSFTKKDLEWIEATVQVKNSSVQVFRDDSLIFHTNYENSLGQVYGVEYFFVGNGEIDYLYLWDEKDSLIIEDDF